MRKEEYSACMFGRPLSKWLNPPSGPPKDNKVSSNVKYWFLTIRTYEVYLDLKSNRPWIIDIHRDKTNGDVSLWIAKLFVSISNTKRLKRAPPLE